jgi:hypothetical protein
MGREEFQKKGGCANVQPTTSCTMRLDPPLRRLEAQEARETGERKRDLTPSPSLRSGEGRKSGDFPDQRFFSHIMERSGCLGNISKMYENA